MPLNTPVTNSPCSVLVSTQPHAPPSVPSDQNREFPETRMWVMGFQFAAAFSTV